MFIAGCAAVFQFDLDGDSRVMLLTLDRPKGTVTEQATVSRPPWSARRSPSLADKFGVTHPD